MEFRQRHEHGNKEIEGQIDRHFVLPPVKAADGKSQAAVFANYVYLTQIQQALCYETGVSRWRRAMSTPNMTMGTLYWQLNDVRSSRSSSSSSNNNNNNSSSSSSSSNSSSSSSSSSSNGSNSRSISGGTGQSTRSGSSC